MPKGKPNKRYTPEFKIKVVETMHREKLNHREAERQFDLPNNRVAAWERIYLEKGAEGLYIERRGRKSTRATFENQEGSRRRSDCRSIASSCGECILKKIECLGCRAGTAREKAQVI